MYVLVGLGNPGGQYSLNRHNIGFLAIDAIASTYNFPPFKAKFTGLITESTIGDHKVILCKPMTYMNLSGQCVGDLIRFYKIPSDHVYVIHDDLDLEPGQIKVKIGGGNGGHNGLKSLDQHIGKEYWRIRLGIGHPGRSERGEDRVAGYVLSNFSHNDEEWVSNNLRAVSDEISTLFGSDPGVWLTKIAQNLRG
jgi:peptidyl-tRNA hydrolase, PTH1 family